jgi:hypothetical protein
MARLEQVQIAAVAYPQEAIYSETGTGGRRVRLERGWTAEPLAGRGAETTAPGWEDAKAKEK